MRFVESTRRSPWGGQTAVPHNEEEMPMSGRSYPFFSRGTFLQDGSNSTDYLSEPFDIQDAVSMMLEIRPYGVIGTNPSIAIILQTANTLHASEADWHEEMGTGGSPITAGGGTPIRLFGPGAGTFLGKFARVKVTITGTDVGITFEALGLARSE
jgi:hypothetical protein